MFVSVAAPDTEAQFVTMVSLLDAHEVPYYVHNRYFGSLYPGMQIPLYTLQRIMVAGPYAADARELLAPFFAPPLEYETERRFAWTDRVRGVVEFVVCGWVVACKRWRPGQTREDS